MDPNDLVNVIVSPGPIVRDYTYLPTEVYQRMDWSIITSIASREQEQLPSYQTEVEVIYPKAFSLGWPFNSGKLGYSILHCLDTNEVVELGWGDCTTNAWKNAFDTMNALKEDEARSVNELKELDSKPDIYPDQLEERGW